MAGDTLSSAASPSRWAVIVGVDKYSENELEKNLKGCCNDAVLMYNFLRDCLDIRPENIRLHLARSNAPPATTPDPPSTNATYWNFIGSLDHVMSHATPGDFVHIHFSGHGSREPTLLPNQKGESSEDERLCFADEEMPDHELGARLDEMTALPKRLVIFVTLDCCFSGGAERLSKDWVVRCKPRSGQVHSTDIPSSSSTRSQVGKSEDDGHSSRSARNTSLHKGWLYRDRKYNVIAACQPHEKSVEGPAASGLVHGALTSTLIKELENLGNRRSSTTYGVLQDLVEAIMKGTLSRCTTQQPMLLGPRNRVLFESVEHGSTRGSPNYMYVLNVKDGRIVADKGQISGISIGDIYCLSNPREYSHHPNDPGRVDSGLPKDSTKILITKVREYESEAEILEELETTLLEDRLGCIQSGWLAKLVKEARKIYAQIHHDDTEKSIAIAKVLKNECQSFMDASRPIILSFPDEARHEGDAQPDFHVNILNGELEVCSWEDEPFPYLPTIPVNICDVTSPIDVANRLIYMLWHMRSFMELRDKKSPSNPHPQAAAFMFTVTASETQAGGPDIVSSWKVSFTNKYSRPLFITVFNLTPLHGVFQIMPSEEGHAKQVFPGENIAFEIDIVVPQALSMLFQEDPSFIMRDILKIFVTTEHIDLHQYELEDLVGDIASGPRHAKSRPLLTEPRASWWIETKEIITRSHLK